MMMFQSTKEKTMASEDPGGAGSQNSPVHSNHNSNGNGGAAAPIRRFVSRAQYLFGIKSAGSLSDTVAEAIEEHESAGGQEKQLLRKVLAFNELEVADVMTPRADIIAVDYSVTLDDLKEVLLREVHTRVPVYRNTLDDVVGFVHAKDLLKVLCTGGAFNMKSLVRQALFVPPSMMVSALLMKMRLSRVHMALVVDEFGGTSGLVTLEDLMEEIVGDIEDEHDEEDDSLFTRLGSTLFEASARIGITELERKLGMPLKTEEDAEDYDTLGGLIFYMLGRVPARGEIVVHPNGLEFEITDADLRRIRRVLIRRKPR
jgi:magnesium and cobalt transporter